MKKWQDFKKELLKNKKVAAEYERLNPRYQLISQLIDARVKRGVSQKDLARKMGTKQSAISRLESGSINPSIAFLEKLTQALGAKLEIQVK